MKTVQLSSIFTVSREIPAEKNETAPLMRITLVFIA